MDTKGVQRNRVQHFTKNLMNPEKVTKQIYEGMSVNEKYILMPINKKKNFRKVTILSKKTDAMGEVMGEVKNKNFFEMMEKRIWNMDSQEKWRKLETNRTNKPNF